jgi:polyisoprenoid-binding protein YceI
MNLRLFAFICGSMLLLASLGSVGRAFACELPPVRDPGRPRIVYRVEEGQGQVRFDAKAFMHDLAGKTSKVTGAIRLADPDRLTEAEACVRVDAASLDTGNGTRDDIMRKDHLETATFPTIDFLLRSLEGTKAQSGGWELVAKGSLSLHGVTREILLPIRARQEGDSVRLTGDIPLKMTDYRIRIPKFLFFTVEDQVVVSFDVAARRVQ